MKKIIILLASALCTISVFACAKPEATSSSTIEESSIQDVAKYQLTVSGIGVTLNVSPDLPKNGEYEAGHEFEFKIKVTTDHDFTPYLNDVVLEHFKREYGYNYYSFTMPESESTLYITDDPFYLKEIYSFNDIFTWVSDITETNLKGIKIEYGYIGVDPETNTPTFKYSEELDDLKYNIDILNTEKIVKTNGSLMPPGGYYRTITYILKSGNTYSFTIQNEYIKNYQDSTVSFYKFISETPKLPDIITVK